MNRNKIIAISVIVMAVLLFSGCVEKETNRENTITTTLIENEPYMISPDNEVSDVSRIMISGYISSAIYSSNYGGHTPFSIVLRAIGGHHSPKSIIDQKELQVGEEIRVASDGKNKSIIIKSIYFGTIKGEKRVMANVIIRENP